MCSVDSGVRAVQLTLQFLKVTALVHWTRWVVPCGCCMRPASSPVAAAGLRCKDHIRRTHATSIASQTVVLLARVYGSPLVCASRHHSACLLAWLGDGDTSAAQIEHRHLSGPS